MDIFETVTIDELRAEYQEALSAQRAEVHALVDALLVARKREAAHALVDEAYARAAILQEGHFLMLERDVEACTQH